MSRVEEKNTINKYLQCILMEKGFEQGMLARPLSAKRKYLISLVAIADGNFFLHLEGSFFSFPSEMDKNVMRKTRNLYSQT